MAFTNPPEFLAVSTIILFLECSTSVIGLIFPGDGSPADDRWEELFQAYDRLKTFIADFQAELSQESPSNSTSKALRHLKTRCLNLAITLADPIGETITALATEDIKNPDPEQSKKLALLRFNKPTGIDETCVRLSADLVSWLALALQSDDWPSIVQLRKIREEAKAIRSRRADHIDNILQIVRTVLSQHLPKTAAPPRGRRLLRARNHAHPDSSDESGQESDHRQISKKPREKRPDPGHKSAAEPPNTLDAGHQGEASTTVLELNEMVTSLVTMDLIVCDVPAELRILQALSFDAIDSREDSIQDADVSTFRWLLEEPVEQDLEPHMATARQSLYQWLGEGQNIYHISGKSGSGKSTILKLIANHPRTKSELEKWAGEKDLIIASFYFWNSGNAAQTSWGGLQRSVLLQFLRHRPMQTRELFPETFQKILELTERGETASDSTLVNEGNIWAAWKVMCTKKEAYRMCIFIDGLDEFTETEAIPFSSLAHGLRNICHQNRAFKLCVSSRPLPQIQTVFDRNQRIHLHELTSRDIRSAASSAILAIPNLEKLTKEGGERLVTTIVTKSQGVFVWVKTVLCNIQAVVTSLGRLPDNAIAEALDEKISAYPSDIEDLYDHLLKQTNSSQISMTALMFGLVIDNPFAQPPNAMWFYWAEQLTADPDFPGKSDSTPCADPYAAEEVRSAHNVVKKALVTLTKGLLTMHKDSREREDGDQFYRQRVQFSHRTARDFFRSARGHSHIDFLEPSVSSLLDQASSSSYSPQSSVSAEAFARLRLAEIVLAGKHRVAAGADPRRRRLYSNYLRSLFSLKTDSELSYQVPFKFMEILRKDLETTHSGKFGSAYVVASFRSINKLTVTEDPEQPASFRHLALAHGQYDYLLKDFHRNQTPGNDPDAEGKGTNRKAKGKCKGKCKETKATSADDLSLLLTAVFGKTNSGALKSKFTTLLPFHNAMASIPIRPPVGNDFLSEISLEAGTPLIFSSTFLFSMHRTLGGLYRTQDSIPQNFELLARLVVHGLELADADTTPLNFVFLLQTRQDCRAPAPEPRPASEKDSVTYKKSIPKELHEWITSPMKNASGEPIFSKSTGAHPCGLVIKETHHTTLKTVFSLFVDDKALFERFCELVPGDVSGAVLNEQSEVFANCVSGSLLDQYVCTRVVASDGLVVDAGSDLCFRVY